MNYVSLFGRIDSEPELLGMPGRDVFEFWLEVPGRREGQTLHVRVVAFDHLAQRFAEELSEGDQIAVGGRLRSERWPGSRRLYRHSVIAREVRAARPQTREAAADA